MKKLSEVYFVPVNESRTYDLQDGEYTGNLCGCSFHVNELDKDFELRCGAMAAYEGRFRVESGKVYLIEGFEDFGGNKFVVDPPSSPIGVF